jgi:cyclopropane fatty-acyl-phospholipid synthase-like methyltransferase
MPNKQALDREAHDTIWHGTSDHNALLRKIVGTRFGEFPLDRLDEILAEKTRVALAIAGLLAVTKEDTVLDVGAGAGLVAAGMASLCKKVCCLDISSDQRDFAMGVILNRVSNVSYEVMPYGDLSLVSHEKISHAYSTAVFIHFNIYDVLLYLEAIGSLLPKGGKFYFTFMDADRTDPETHDDFLLFVKRYTLTLDSRYYLMPHSPSLVKKIAQMKGFSLLDEHEAGAANRAFILAKT